MEDRKGREPIAGPANRVLGFAENVVYSVAGLLLVGSAVVVLVAIAFHFVADADDGVVAAVTEALDGLLLVFILLELLAAVRATIIEHRLVAEPFLVVGIIASIKEIVVVSLKAKDVHGEAFQDVMLEIGVLGALVLALAVATLLVRRKEREPDEGDAPAAR